ncbi:SRPBCC domain-containing protein [Plantactinospora sp. GCM10030261]|uniref:SRPBCC family protein n=1 Tax=Plantactinospora sp. GCM10030261 TaxID=3273420 RepID=UPI00361E52AB
MSGRTTVTKIPETRQLIIERTLSAAVSTVWLSWTRPEHVARWWGPRGWTTTVHEMDVRPGGRWRFSMAPTGGGSALVRCVAVYREVQENRRLTYVDAFADEMWRTAGEDAGTENFVTFDPAGAATRLTITTHFNSLDELTQAEAMGMVEGYLEALDRLAAHLTTVA